MLLTDVIMPRLSGNDLARQLGQVRLGLKVLYISGYTGDSIIRREVVESGVAFVQKPFSPNVLLRRVREVLDRGPVLTPAGR
jgi:FixJ family two-component response regulator